MQNKIQTGATMDWTNGTGTDVASGQPVHVGAFTCVAVGVIKNGESGVLARKGVYQFKKDTPLVISQGDSVFWSTADKEVTKTATDKYLGIAAKSAASNDTTVIVDIADAAGEINRAASVATVATANGSDAATTQALANQLKTTVNAILSALKNADLMDTP